MKTAIFICYYQYPYFPTLKELYIEIAKQYGKTVEEIKSGIRSSLITVNNSRNRITKKTILDIFDKSYNITPKDFLKTFVTHLRYAKNNRKK